MPLWKLGCIIGLVTTLTYYTFFSNSEMADSDSHQQGNSPSMSDSYTFKKEDVPNGSKFSAKHGDNHVPYMTAMDLLKNNNINFMQSFLEVLRNGVNHGAYFFETPPVTADTAGNTDFEFVLMDASKSLGGVSVDMAPFSKYFKGCGADDSDVVSFPNLGKDAILVVPCPVAMENNNNYSHLANFVKKGKESQVVEFWMKVGAEVGTRLMRAPKDRLWVSTSGLGVYYLHARLDSYPKYYTYGPYKKGTN